MVLNKTVVQSATNTVIIAVLTQFFDNGADIFALNADSAKALINTAIVTALWVVFRYVSPSGSRFSYQKNPAVKAEAAPAPAKKSATKKPAAKKTTPKKAAQKKAN